jgi:hypothetical protein
MSQEGVKALGFCTGLLLLALWGLYTLVRRALTWFWNKF